MHGRTCACRPALIRARSSAAASRVASAFTCGRRGGGTAWPHDPERLRALCPMSLPMRFRRSSSACAFFENWPSALGHTVAEAHAAKLTEIDDRASWPHLRSSPTVHPAYGDVPRS